LESGIVEGRKEDGEEGEMEREARGDEMRTNKKMEMGMEMEMWDVGRGRTERMGWGDSREPKQSRAGFLLCGYGVVSNSAVQYAFLTTSDHASERTRATKREVESGERRKAAPWQTRLKWIGTWPMIAKALFLVV
jgi:hypothetical protein